MRDDGATEAKGNGKPVRCQPAVLAVMLIAVAGCAGPRQDIQSSSLAQRTSIERSFIDTPPGGPAILGVVERTYSNAITQEITLENHASVVNDNKFWVTMMGPVRLTTAADNRYYPDQMSTLNVSREFGWYLPGIKMNVSNYYTQNRYGPFGYAVGQHGIDTCIYAWQRIQSDNTNGNWFSRQGAVIIRLRFCAPHASEMELLTLMTSFTINSFFLNGRWNPYGAAPPPPDGIGRPGVSILPVTSATTTPAITAQPLGPVRTLAAPATVRPATTTRVVRRPVAPAAETIAAPPVETIQPGAAVVPLTTGVTATDRNAAGAQPGGAVAPTDPAAQAPLEGYPAVPSP